MSYPTISELVEAIKTGSRSALDVVEESLQRAAETEAYHAILELSAETARNRAREIDEQIAAGTAEGELLGVPFLAKDNFLTRHTRTTAASKLLRNFQSPYQATAIDKLEAAGAIMLGKVNLDEFAHGSSTENSAFGPTKNPHDETRVPGGSSGGSAAAVALGITPFALGTDTGGSIRLPASFCGVVGLKPTYGAVSRFGVIAMASSTDVIGPLTRNVADAGVVLDVIAGADPADSTTIARETSYQVGAADLKGVRVGIVDGHLGPNVDAAVKDRTQSAIKTMEAAGAEIVPVDIPDDAAALAVYYIIVPAEISSNLARYDGVKYGESDETAKDLLDTYLRSRGNGFGEEPVRRILTGTYVLSSGYQDAYYKQAQSVRTLLREEYESVFSGVDVLVGPTAPTPAFKLGEKQDPLSMYMTDSLTIAANLVGSPALSLPLPGKEKELPVGLQLVGPQRQDKRLLEIAAAVEALL